MIEEQKNKKRERDKKYRAKRKKENPNYQKIYYQKNREHLLEARKKYLKKNKEKNAIWHKIWWQKNKEKYKEHIKEYGKIHRLDKINKIYIRIYGIGLKDKLDIWVNQKKKCAICGKKLESNTMKMAIDHCHKNNKIRGVLCLTCNSMIGYAHDNPNVLRKGATYLESNS